MNLCAGYSGTQHFLGCFGCCQHGFECASDHWFRFAFDVCPGHIPPVAGGITAGKDVRHDRFTCQNRAAADVMRFRPLRTMSENGPVRAVPHPFEIAFEFGAKEITGQQFAVVFQYPFGIGSGVNQNLPEFAHDFFRGVNRLLNRLDFRGFLDLAFREKGMTAAFQPDSRLHQFFRLGKRETRRNFPAADVQTAAQGYGKGFIRMFPVEKYGTVQHFDVRCRFGNGAGIFQRRNHDTFFRICFIIKEFIGGGKAAGIEQVGAFIGGCYDEFRKSFCFST